MHCSWSTTDQAGDIIALDGEFATSNLFCRMSISTAVYFNGTNWQLVSSMPATAGDTNYDGDVNVVDLVRMAKYQDQDVADLFANTTDVTADGNVDDSDAQALRMRILETAENM